MMIIRPQTIHPQNRLDAQRGSSQLASLARRGAFLGQDPLRTLPAGLGGKAPLDP